jgi:peptidoglycan/LPS O-acetylase OafA/YrhL
MIVVGHTGAAFGLRKDIGQSEHFCCGQAVSFFFVLSGFILAHVYPELRTAGDRGRFVLARFARLWPTHIACTLILFTLVGWPLWTWWNLFLALMQLTMVHAWMPVQGVNVSWNCPSWSISTEFFFYLSFVLLIERWEQTWLRKLLLALAMLAGMLLLCWLDPFSEGAASAGCRFLYTQPLARLFEFTLGMTASLCWRWLTARVRIGPVLGTMAELAAFALVALNMYHYRTIAMCVPCVGQLTWFLQADSCFSFAILITVLAAEWGWLSRALTLRSFTVLGDISYAIYLVHYPLSVGADRYTEQIASLPMWLTYGAFWAVLLLTCLLLWFMYERPARAFLLGLWPKPEPQSQPRPSLARAA